MGQQSPMAGAPSTRSKTRPSGYESPLRIGERVTYTGCIEYQRTASTVGEEETASSTPPQRPQTVQEKWGPDPCQNAASKLSPGGLSAASTTTDNFWHRPQSPFSGTSSPTRPQSAQSFRSGVSDGSGSPTRAVYISSRNYGDASRPRSPLGATEKLGGRAWVQGFTGHVPHERGAYGVTKARAVEHVSNTVPPLSPMVQVQWSRQGTQRNLTVPHGLAMVGNSCPGSQHPTETDAMFNSSHYAQGSKVDVDYFYDAVAATSPLNVASPSKQALAMQKIRSRNVVNGDKFYFAGKQHYDTTHMETFAASANEDGDIFELDNDTWMLAVDSEGKAYSPMAMSPAPSSRFSSSRPSSASSYTSAARRQKKQDTRVHDYKAAAAVVGRKKLDALVASLQSKIYGRIGVQASGSFQRMWRYFDKANSGKVPVSQLYDVCWQLGVQVTKTEARALMSRYDVDLDGYIDFHEFLQNVLQEAELDQDCNAQRRVQAR